VAAFLQKFADPLVETIATADDNQVADGKTILSFSQAQAKVRDLAKNFARPGPTLRSSPSRRRSRLICPATEAATSTRALQCMY
jgi:hypothetical protein